MSMNGDLVLRHAWFGPLYEYGKCHLVGSIDVDSRIRRSRDNGEQDAEILIETTGLNPGPALDERVDQAADRVRDALANLEAIKQHAVDQPPTGWLEFVRSLGPGTPLDRLFLDGFEVTADLVTAVLFDFGDLDTIVVRLDAQGTPLSVELAR